MREQSFRWVGHLVNGMELVFALTGPGMGLGGISFVWGMAADGNRHVCRNQRTRQRIYRALVEKVCFKFFDLYLASLLNYNLCEAHYAHLACTSLSNLNSNTSFPPLCKVLHRSSRTAKSILISWPPRKRNVHHSLDRDTLALVFGRLGDRHVQDTILEAGLDGILVDARGKGEGAVEFADRSLGHPEFGAAAGFGRGLIMLLGDLGALAAFFPALVLLLFAVLLVFDSGLVAGIPLRDIASDAASRVVSAVRGVFALNATFDD